MIVEAWLELYADKQDPLEEIVPNAIQLEAWLELYTDKQNP